MRLSRVVVAKPSLRTPSMLMASFPLERTLHPLVDEAHDEDEEEHHHRPESEAADLVERDGPRKKERDLEVEQDEQDRDQVVAHVELHARVLEGLEAAFVGRQLLAVRTVRPEDGSRGDQRAAEHQGDRDEQQYREVVFQHFSKMRTWPEVSPSDPSPPLFGADGETRTLTAFATAPSRRRVYQFHHVGMSGLTGRRSEPQAARFYYFGTSFAFDFSASCALAASGAAGAG